MRLLFFVVVAPPFYCRNLISPSSSLDVSQTRGY